MFGDGADAAEPTRVLVGDEPIAALSAPFGQHGHEVLEAARDEVMDDAEADPGAQRLKLGDGAGGLEAGRRAAIEFAHVVERGRERMLLDIADQPDGVAAPRRRRARRCV